MGALWLRVNEHNIPLEARARRKRVIWDLDNMSDYACLEHLHFSSSEYPHAGQGDLVSYMLEEELLGIFRYFCTGLCKLSNKEGCFFYPDHSLGSCQRISGLAFSKNA